MSFSLQQLSNLYDNIEMKKVH